MNTINRIRLVGISLLILSFTISCKQQPAEETTTGNTAAQPVNRDEKLISTDVVSNTTEITFEKDKHDFGEIKQGDVVSYDFRFTNTGENDLIISSAKGTCGCTVPAWPKHPIKPGESDVIKVQFDSKNKKGAQNKTVTVTANTIPSGTKLTFTGTVIESK